ncbi:hypothetical protein [Neptunicoccus sediminis]|uniref:hypothetical protein n=1 Tax=Neptunicoccus sediminis TaxID=1892596 RepID=UPI000845E586|nr:hypothetical protein [Neptunicoccus sediminis]
MATHKFCSVVFLSCAPLGALAQGLVGGITTEAIRTSQLDTVQTDAVGILSPAQSGIPQEFWGDSDVATLARLVAPFHEGALPRINALWQRIVLSEVDPPRNVSKKGALLLARVDYLINAGALEQAEALLDRAGQHTPALFRRAFDVGLLAGRAQFACAAMLRNPSLSPDYKARVFCLARANDWSAAALTLTTAKVLGQISEDDEELLARFLDPELFEESEAPPPPVPLNALDFTMREALALPRSGRALPLAFLHGDLHSQTGWRNQVLATERLVRSGAIPPDRLITLYQDGEPAASGGIWVRISAVQKLIEAIENDDAEAVSAALPDAYRSLRAVGLEFALSGLAADALRDMELTPEAAAIRYRLWLVQSDYADLTFDYEPQDSAEAFLQAIAQAQPLQNPKNDIEAAVMAAFNGTTLDVSAVTDARQGRFGEAILRSTTDLIASRYADPLAVEACLSALLLAGMEDDARQIALAVLLQKAQQI